ncbi:hypothetical protein TNCV_222111 [Trichonephila clavipes]|nr:hypothetical protein TNCV_222111 [Trichonephila clavipes]
MKKKRQNRQIHLNKWENDVVVVVSFPKGRNQCCQSLESRRRGSQRFASVGLPHHSSSESVEGGGLDEIGSRNLTRLPYRFVVLVCTRLVRDGAGVALLVQELCHQSPLKNQDKNVFPRCKVGYKTIKVQQARENGGIMPQCQTLMQMNREDKECTEGRQQQPKMRGTPLKQLSINLQSQQKVVPETSTATHTQSPIARISVPIAYLLLVNGVHTNRKVQNAYDPGMGPQWTREPCHQRPGTAFVRGQTPG